MGETFSSGGAEGKSSKAPSSLNYRGTSSDGRLPKPHLGIAAIDIWLRDISFKGIRFGAPDHSDQWVQIASQFVEVDQQAWQNLRRASVS